MKKMFIFNGIAAPLRAKCKFFALLFLLHSAAQADSLLTPEALDRRATSTYPVNPNWIAGATTPPAAPASSPAHRDLWLRVRGQLRWSSLENSRIAAERRWYLQNPEYLARVTERAGPYLHHVVEEIERRGMPMELALLPIVESAYDPFAYSHGRAAGLWQIIPGTGRHLGLTQDWWYDGRRDVRASTDAALNYLQELGETFSGDWLKALAAYNAGPNRILRAEADNRRRGRSTDFWSLSLPRETQNYVPRLLALTDLIANPKQYGQSLTAIPDTAFFNTVQTGGQIDLAQAARLAGVDIDTVYMLNPGYNRWATAPEGPHELLLPAHATAEFARNLTELDSGERVQWVRHTVRRGDTLTGIAQRYNTDAAVIRSVNQLRGDRIVVGDSVLIPIASAPPQTYSLSADQRLAARQSRGQGHRVEYRVRRGDSFWSIARDFGVDTRRLAEWNNLAVRDSIHPGQTLVIWSRQPVNEVTLTSADFQVPERAPMLRKIGYRVRKGDSLARIAGKFKISVDDILNWNRGLKGKKFIYPGQRITLYVDIAES